MVDRNLAVWYTFATIDCNKKLKERRTWYISADATMKQMKRKLIIFSMVVMAFIAMPLLRVSAASTSIGGKLEDKDVSGYLEITDTSATAITGCENSAATCTVSLTFYFTNESAGTIEEVSGWDGNTGLAKVVKVKPQGSNYRSYKATSTHSVKFGAYQWNPNSISVYLNN